MAKSPATRERLGGGSAWSNGNRTTRLDTTVKLDERPKLTKTKVPKRGVRIPVGKLQVGDWLGVEGLSGFYALTERAEQGGKTGFFARTVGKLQRPLFLANSDTVSFVRRP